MKHGAHDSRVMPPANRATGQAGDAFDTWASAIYDPASFFHPRHPFPVNLLPSVAEDDDEETLLAGLTAVPWNRPESLPSKFVTFALAMEWDVDVTATTEEDVFTYSGTIAREGRSLAANPAEPGQEEIPDFRTQFERLSRPESGDESQLRLYTKGGNPGGTIEGVGEEGAFGGNLTLQIEIEGSGSAHRWYAGIGYFTTNLIGISVPGGGAISGGITGEWNYFGDLVFYYDDTDVELSGTITPSGALPLVSG